MTITCLFPKREHLPVRVRSVIEQPNAHQQMSKLIPPFCIGRIKGNRTTVGSQRFLCVVEKGQSPKMTGGLSRLLMRRLPFGCFARQNSLEDRLSRFGIALLQLGKSLCNTRWGMGLAVLLDQSRDGVGK